MLLSAASFVASVVLAPGATSMIESATQLGRLINLFYYLPALVLVLRRPNVDTTGARDHRAPR